MFSGYFGSVVIESETIGTREPYNIQRVYDTPAVPTDLTDTKLLNLVNTKPNISYRYTDYYLHLYI